MKKLEDFQKAGEEIFDKLHLSTYPVGIKYIKEESEIPDNAMRPSSMGAKMSLCQAFTQTRRWGTTVAMTADDNFCTPSTAFHGWADVSYDELVESQVQQGWHASREAEEKRHAGIKKFSDANNGNLKTPFCGLVSTPLTKPAVVPDTVLVFGDGTQVNHIIHALSYEYKHVPKSSFDGFIESCGKGGFIPFITQKPQVVIPGAGDRSFAGIQDHEIGAGMPGELIFYVLENLFKTGGAMNSRFPVRTMVPMNLNENLTPGFKYLRDIIDKGK